VTIELTKILVWPIFFLIVILFFRSKVRLLLDILTSSMLRAKKVSVGPLSLELEKRAFGMGNPELAVKVGSLSGGAIQMLLKIPTGPGGITLTWESHYHGEIEYCLPSERQIECMRELVAKKLIEFRYPLEPFLEVFKSYPRVDGINDPNIRYYKPITREHREDFTYNLTENGRVAVDLIIGSVAAQLSELK